MPFRLQRQDAVVAKKDDGFRCCPLCGPARLIRFQCFFQKFRVPEGMFKQTHAEFFRENPQDRPVQDSYVCLSGRKPRLKFIAIRKRGGKLNIQTGIKTIDSRIRIAFTDLFDIKDLGGRAVVRDCNAVKPHFLPEHSGQISRIGGEGNTVHHVVAGHNAFQMCFADGCLEASCVDLTQLALSDGRAAAVDTAP